MKRDGPTLWLVMQFAPEAMRHGVQILGSPGSGKSVLLRALRGSIIKLMSDRPNFDLHQVDFDTKRDLYSLQQAVLSICPVFDLNPFVWADSYDPLGDIDDPRDIAELMGQMVDVSANSSQPFFPQAAQYVLGRAATRHWLMAPDAVRFADLVLTGNDPERLRTVLRSHPHSAGALSLVNDTDAGLSVLATLLTEVSKFEPMAALMRSNARGRTTSVRSLLAKRFSVTALPYEDKSVATLAPFTRLFLTKLQQTLLAENAPNRLVFLILDELALIPKGVDLSLAAVKGREAGLCLVLAYQSPTMARTVFGKDRFDALVSTVKTTVVLNLPDPLDAEWASKRLGAHQGFLRVESASSTSSASGGSSTRGWSESFVTLDNLTPGLVQELPVPTPGSPVIEGFMATLPFKPFRFKLDVPGLLATLVPKVPPAAPPPPRDAKDMLLTEWQSADYRRLRLK